jgi:hypothetical protein
VTNPLIGEEVPADEPGGEFEVIGVERLGWFSADVVIAARRTFTRRRPARGGFRFRVARLGLEAEIAIRQGETFRLLLPGRDAQRGLLLDFDAIADNPAFEAGWRGGGG